MQTSTMSLPEKDLVFVQQVFDSISKHLNVGYDVLNFLKERIHGILFFIVLNSFHHDNRKHRNLLNFSFEERLFCGLCNVRFWYFN